MSREWKPGDVAASDVNGKTFIIFRSEVEGSREARWYDRFGALLPDIEWPHGRRIRSLVVIDPESDADIARMENVLEAHGCRVGTAVQAALREFADPAPPKPEEPTGLGAVVEDDEGRQWIRVDWCNPWCLARPTQRTNGDGLMHGTHRLWEKVAAVRVLSEGVQ